MAGGSPQSNFLCLLQHTEAPYVAFSDQDDVWLPPKLSLSIEAMHALQRQHPSGSPLLVFTDYRQLPATSDALQAAGWVWRGIVPWHKPNSRPHRGGFRRACEYVLWGTNGPVDGDRNPVYLPGLVTGSQPRGAKRHHITAKPIEVMRELVRICPPGATILDPFAGSGTTGVAALAEGRSFVGIEMTATYFQTARTRLAEAETAVGG